MKGIQTQKGFTLIELIIVIVIIALLAAVGIPRFTDLSEGAKKATAQALAQNLNSAHSINYSASLMPDPFVTVKNISDCKDSGILLEDGIPNGFKVGEKPIPNTAPWITDCNICLVSDSSCTTILATFTGRYVQR
ncbi:prepilin-type N-terminal cleavage/methylation domain-containing protein [Ectothiorhodospira shaposhnikovii]|uniref:prepilin-type N-terminal cleavage/methylation domain-containing protein n=1 Tax=Ectothiorhodospira shaposhnikovii TaxID=1054 RepID=UPI001F0A4EAC|nr:prepilin-type N-terminal cleavage/methylation domain-containing protein [Ectothiorhodospira shaposhnikovii]